ncbi:MAG: serine/threonine protein kinase [bacterium]|nr:serine/threonine protein kinase [bacterium]
MTSPPDNSVPDNSGSPPPPDGQPNVDREALGNLVIRCILEFEQHGEPAIERLLASEPGLADRAREQLEALRSAGLLVPPAPDPQRIGGYEIVRRLGTGGVGSVYLAEQSEPVRRRVAIKVIRPGMDSREVLARFALERQALAAVDHPSVARVLDAGTTADGQPFLCMDYVPGKPITRYCDAERLTIDERVELMVRVCDAVQAAHQKGILHRDLKPSNVLVSRREDRSWPTVIDFGIAKSLGPRLLDVTQLTGRGRIVGTPEYMSPEQARNEADVDTRTDIYALGVVLYELLSGCLPFASERLRTLGNAELVRTLGEEQPARIEVAAISGAEAGKRAHERRTTVAGLARALRGELDWIVGKAIDKDPNRRYAMAADLAADLSNYLRRDPVAAGPPTTWYRWRKLVQRHRLEFSAVVAVVVALTTGLVLSLTFYSEARAQSETARASLAVAIDAVDRMVKAGDDRLEVVPRMEEVRRELLAEALELHERLAALAQDQMVDLRTIRAFAGLAKVQAQLGDRDLALQTAADAKARLLQLPATALAQADARSVRLEIASLCAIWTHTSTGDAAVTKGFLAEARAELAALAGIAGRRTANRLIGAQVLVLTAEVERGDAGTTRALADEATALLDPILERAAGRSEAVGDEDGGVAEPAEPLPEPGVLAPALASMSQVARLLLDVGDVEGATAVAARAQAVAAAEFARDPDLIARARLLPAMGALATIRYRSEEFGRTVAELAPVIETRRRLARDFPGLPTHRHSLAVALGNSALAQERLYEFDDALASLREAFELCDALVAEEPEASDYSRHLVAAATALVHHATIRARFGIGTDREIADAARRRAAAVIAGDERFAMSANAMLDVRAEFHRVEGVMLLGRKELEPAAAALRLAIEAFDRLREDRPGLPRIASRALNVRINLAQTLVDLERFGDALALLHDGLAQLEALATKLPNRSDLRLWRRQLLMTEARARIGLARFDGVIGLLDRYLGLADDPKNDLIGNQEVAKVALGAVGTAADEEWRERFAVYCRERVAAGAPTTSAAGAPPSTMARIMASNGLQTLVALERRLGRVRAAAAAQARVVEGYAAAFDGRPSERSKRRLATALEQLAALADAASDAPAAAAARERLERLSGR